MVIIVDIYDFLSLLRFLGYSIEERAKINRAMWKLRASLGYVVVNKRRRESMEFSFKKCLYIYIILSS